MADDERPQAWSEPGAPGADPPDDAGTEPADYDAPEVAEAGAIVGPDELEERLDEFADQVVDQVVEEIRELFDEVRELFDGDDGGFV